jgi:branched-chain amino acid transport system substrate-binding protein
MKKWSLIATLAASAFALPALAQTQGVSKTEIVVGTIQDLSGPLAGYGKHVRAGIQLRFDELNEQGGVHGRKLKLIVEDSGYDPKKAVLAAQKLVNQDKIFAMLGHLGTAHNNAAMPIQFEKERHQLRTHRRQPVKCTNPPIGSSTRPCPPITIRSV